MTSKLQKLTKWALSDIVAGAINPYHDASWVAMWRATDGEWIGKTYHVYDADFLSAWGYAGEDEKEWVLSSAEEQRLGPKLAKALTGTWEVEADFTWERGPRGPSYWDERKQGEGQRFESEADESLGAWGVDGLESLEGGVVVEEAVPIELDVKARYDDALEVILYTVEFRSK
jgi:hypothetical protein